MLSKALWISHGIVRTTAQGLHCILFEQVGPEGMEQGAGQGSGDPFAVRTYAGCKVCDAADKDTMVISSASDQRSSYLGLVAVQTFLDV